MATVLDIITDALAELGVASPGETISTDDSAYGLKKLNRLLASWSAEKLALYGVSLTTVAATGAGSYALATRPVAVLSVAVLSTSGLTQPAKMISAEQFSAIIDKAATGTFAEFAYYDGGYPTATVYLAPKPSAGTIQVYSIAAIAAFAALADVINFAPGVERAVVTNLAIDMAPAYGAPGGAAQMQVLAQIAAAAKTAVAQLSAEIQAGNPSVVAQMQAQAAQGAK